MPHLQTRLFRFIAYLIFAFTLEHCNNNIILVYKLGGRVHSPGVKTHCLLKKKIIVNQLVAYKLLREQILSSTLTISMQYGQDSNCFNLQCINYLVECDQNSIIIFIIVRNFIGYPLTNRTHPTFHTLLISFLFAACADG